VDRALVEHAEDDVDGDQCGEDQDRRAGERILKRLRAALEALLNRGRTIWLSLGITGNPASVSSRFNRVAPSCCCSRSVWPVFK
jgi:hypothetical protein